MVDGVLSKKTADGTAYEAAPADEYVDFQSVSAQLAAPYVPEEEAPENSEPTEPEAPKPMKPMGPTTSFDPEDVIGEAFAHRYQQIKKMLQWINSWMVR